LADRLNLSVPISKSRYPVAPYGNAFWCRTIALKNMFDRDWNYEDFPEEPIETGPTLLHAIERLFPFVAQDAGYYPGVVLSDKFAPLEISNLRHYYRNVNLVLNKHEGSDLNSFITCILSERKTIQEECDRLQAELEEKNAILTDMRIRTHVKLVARKIVPRKLYRFLSRTYYKFRKTNSCCEDIEKHE